MNVYNIVLVRVKVLKYCSLVHVSKNKEKQDITSADDSDISKIALWEESIDKLKTNQ